jgi:hypothetical protein
MFLTTKNMNTKLNYKSSRASLFPLLNHRLIAAVILLLLPISVFSSRAQSTIAYFNGPFFCFNYPDGTSFDFDQNGVADFVFLNGPSLTTGDPNSGYTPYTIAPLGSNSILCVGQQVAVVASGTVINANPPGNNVWTNISGATLDTFGFNGQQVFFTSSGVVTNPPMAGWNGPVTPPGGAFLGMRFYAADGLHYGWIHAQLPAPVIVTNGVGALDGPPVILDWAFETRPDTGIVAGAMPVSVPLAAPQIIQPGTMWIGWESQTNVAYQIQFKDSLNAILWTNLGAPISGTATNSSTNVPISGSSRFFRVVLAN